MQLFISDHFATLTLFLLLALGNEHNYERFAAGERCMNPVVLVLLFVAAYMRPFQQVGAFRQSLQGRGLNFRRTALRTFARKSAAERNATSKASSITELVKKSFKNPVGGHSGENNTANRAEAESDLQNFMQQAFAEAELGISFSAALEQQVKFIIFKSIVYLLCCSDCDQLTESYPHRHGRGQKTSKVALGNPQRSRLRGPYFIIIILSPVAITLRQISFMLYFIIVGHSVLHGS